MLVWVMHRCISMVASLSVYMYIYYAKIDVNGYWWRLQKDLILVSPVTRILSLAAEIGL